MADMTLGGGMPSFKFPCTVSPALARDDTFWRAHSTWRAIEDAFEALPTWPDEDPVAAAMLDRATEARDHMFRHPIATATAILAKFEAYREGACPDWTLDGESIPDLIERDLRTLAGIEAAG